MSLWGRCLPRLTSTRESKAGVLARDDPRGLSSAVAILFLRMVLACANDVFWRLAQHIRPVPMELAWRISGDDLACEVCEIVWIFGRTCVVRIDTEVFGGEAKGKGCRKFVEHLHLPIEPCLGIWTERISPAQSRAHIVDAQPAQPFGGGFKAVILEVEPLTDTQPGGKMLQRKLRRAVFVQESHVIVPIVGAALRFLVTRCRGPGSGKIVQAIPMHALHNGH